MKSNYYLGTVVIRKSIKYGVATSEFRINVELHDHRERINCAANSVLVCEIKKKLCRSCLLMPTRCLTCVRNISYTGSNIISSMLHKSSVTHRRTASLLSRNSSGMIDVLLGYVSFRDDVFPARHKWCTHKSCFLLAEEIASPESNAEFNQGPY